LICAKGVKVKAWTLKLVLELQAIMAAETARNDLFLLYFIFDWVVVAKVLLQLFLRTDLVSRKKYLYDAILCNVFKICTAKY